MADIREIAGQIRLKQSRTTVRDTEGDLSFSVTSITSDPVGFTEPVLDLDPDAVFVFTNSEFERVAEYQDLIDVPVDRPAEVDGEYRKRSCVRSFQDVKEATAWSREVADLIVNLTTQLRDYAAVFEDFTEEIVLPNNLFTTLETNIDAYVAIRNELEAIDEELKIAKGKQTVLNQVYAYSRLESDDEQPDSPTLTAVNILRTSLPRLRNSLTNISSKIQSAVGADVGGDQSVPGAIVNLKENVPPKLNQIEAEANATLTALTGIEGGMSSLAGAIADATSDLTPEQRSMFATQLNNIENLYNNLSASSISDWLDSVSVLVAQTGEMLTQYRNNMLTSKSGVDLMAEVIAAGDGVTVDTESAVQRLNTLSTVNNSDLMALKTQIDNDVITKERLYNEKVKEKGIAWNAVVSVNPDVDPEDPYAIFTHRIFSVVT